MLLLSETFGQAGILQVPVTPIPDDSSVLTQALVFIDKEHTGFPAVRGGQHWKRLFDLKAHPSEELLKNVFSDVYLRFSIINTGISTDSIYFFPAAQVKQMTLTRIDEGGEFELPSTALIDGYQLLEIPPGETEFLADLRFSKISMRKFNPQLVHKRFFEQYKTVQQSRVETIYVTGYLICGILLLMIFVAAASYLLNQKTEFLLYGSYAALMFLLLFFSNYSDLKFGPLVTIFVGVIDFTLLVCANILYLAFTRVFLNTKENYPGLDRLFRISEWILLIQMLAFIAHYFVSDDGDTRFLFESFVKAELLILGFLFIIVALVKRTPLLNYLAIGNGFLVVFSLISFYCIFYGKRPLHLFSAPIFYFETGVVFELIFFLLGLTYKTRIELIARTKEQEALKMEAEKNEYQTQLAILNAQQEERKRISEDIHDELGAGVTAIRLYSELLKTKFPQQNLTELNRISNSADELLINLNAIIWTMSNQNDSMDNMISYIRSYIQQYFDGSGIQCRIFIEDNLPNIHVAGEIRRNIFLVIKEATGNIMKHAKATEVNVRLIRENKGIALYIKDNGIGIDLQNIRQFGNGLKNMKKRMESIGVEFSAENHQGTCIKLYYELPNS